MCKKHFFFSDVANTPSRTLCRFLFPHYSRGRATRHFFFHWGESILALSTFFLAPPCSKAINEYVWIKFARCWGLNRHFKKKKKTCFATDHIVHPFLHGPKRLIRVSVTTFIVLQIINQIQDHVHTGNGRATTLVWAERGVVRRT